MKTTFKLLSIACLTAICLTNCSLITPIDTNVNIRFQNASTEIIESLFAENQSIGNLNTNEITEYFNFDLKENSILDLSASIEQTDYSNQLSIMYVKKDMLYCGFGLEQTLMLESGKDYTLELNIDKDYPNSFIVQLVE